MKYLFLILLFPLVTFAHGDYSPTTNITTINQSKGTATAIATGQCSFDWSKSMQGCASIGYYESESAIAVGIGQRAGDLLFSGTVAIEEGGTFSGGAAVNIKFK